MNKRLSRPEVEDRVRTTLQARSQDTSEPAPGAVSAAGWRPPVGAARLSTEEAGEPEVAMLSGSPGGAGPTTRRLVAAAAAVAVIIGVAVQIAGRSGEDGPRSDVRSAPEAPAPAPALPRCGTELPVAVSVPGAEPVEEPMPGADPAAPGQVVVHWQRADFTVEARWPARPRAVYDLRPVADPPAQDIVPSDATTADPPSAQFDLITDDGGAPEIVVEGAVTPQLGCDVMELSYVNGGFRTRYGLQFLPGTEGTPSGSSSDPLAEEAGMPYGRVDLNPLIRERRDVTEAPDTVLACEASPVPRRSGPADLQLRGNTPAEVLQAFEARRPAAGSGYVEMIAPDGTVTYGSDPEGEGWTVLVIVTPGPGRDSWYLGGWHMSGC